MFNCRCRCVSCDHGDAQARHQGALHGLHCAGTGDLDRQGAERRTVDHEIKFDGYRMQVHLANNAIKVYTRRGHDWTKRFKKIADDAWHINAGSAIMDGEVVAPAADGTTDFSVLQNELKGRALPRLSWSRLICFISMDSICESYR
jgi:ATP-dependent DNA ligase